MTQDGMAGGAGNVRTFLVFTDLPVHYEYRAGEWPILPVNTVIEFDTVLRNPEDPSLERRIGGSYFISTRKLRYSTTRPSRAGLTQYLEMSPVSPEARDALKAVEREPS